MDHFNPNMCTTFGKFGTCGRCNRVTVCPQCRKLYCSRECQELDWANHLLVCQNASYQFENPLPLPPDFPVEDVPEFPDNLPINSDLFPPEENSELTFENPLNTPNLPFERREYTPKTRSQSDQEIIAKIRQFDLDSEKKPRKTFSFTDMKSEWQSSNNSSGSSPSTPENEIQDLWPNLLYLKNEKKDVICMHKESENRFWVMDCRNLTKFYEIKYTMARDSENLDYIEPEIGMVYGVYYKNEWCRAKLISDTPIPVVRFIDFGDTLECPTYFRQLPDHLAWAPGLVFLIEYEEGTPMYYKSYQSFYRKMVIQETKKAPDGVPCVRVVESRSRKELPLPAFPTQTSYF